MAVKTGGRTVNKSVPTLLGIIIILMVVVLVVLIYDYKLTSGLATGRVVGTVGGKMMTGVEPPTEEIGIGEVLGTPAEAEPQPSPALRPDTRTAEISRQAQADRTARAAGEKKLGSPAEGIAPTKDR